MSSKILMPALSPTMTEGVINKWLVKEGEYISIEAATVAGDIRDVLNKIIQIEPEEITSHNGVCSHVWVDALSITGEAWR